MEQYRVVKWWPDKPGAKQLAVSKVFTDLVLAERIKARLEEELPYCHFAIELVEESPTEPATE